MMKNDSKGQVYPIEPFSCKKVSRSVVVQFEKILLHIHVSHHYNILQIPYIVGYSLFYRWRNAQGLVNSAKVIVHKMKADGMHVIFQLLAECGLKDVTPSPE